MRRYPYPTPEVERRATAIRAAIGDDPLYFTLLSNLTTLADRCTFALAVDGTLAARYADLPFAAVSFYGQKEGLPAALGALLASDEPCYVLVGEGQWAQLEGAVRVLNVHPEWQMVYRGHGTELDVGDAVPLRQGDLAAMRALAVRGEMMAFEHNALEKGPYCGVWREGRLVAMAGTHLKLERMAELGNIVTDPDYRRQGLASRAVAATVSALRAEGLLAFLQVFLSNSGAIALYEKLGFERARRMYLVEFTL